MRALTSVILLFVLNLIGLGLGRLAIGILSDSLARQFGIESLRYALLILSFLAPLWAAFHYWCAAKTIRKDAAGPLPSRRYRSVVCQHPVLYCYSMLIE